MPRLASGTRFCMNAPMIRVLTLALAALLGAGCYSARPIPYIPNPAVVQSIAPEQAVDVLRDILKKGRTVTGNPLDNVQLTRERLSFSSHVVNSRFDVTILFAETQAGIAEVEGSDGGPYGVAFNDSAGKNIDYAYFFLHSLEDAKRAVDAATVLHEAGKRK
jgi:hypothetical protein